MARTTVGMGTSVCVSVCVCICVRERCERKRNIVKKRNKAVYALRTQNYFVYIEEGAK